MSTNDPSADYLFQEMLGFCPRFGPHWQTELMWWGDDENPHPRYRLFNSFSGLIAEQLKRGDTSGLVPLFAWVETLVAGDDDDLANAAQTCFLENLLNQVPSAINPDLFVPLLGPESAKWCRVWDGFTGVKTKGLECRRRC